MITDEQREKIVDRFRKYSEHFPNWYSFDTLLIHTFEDVLGVHVKSYDYEQIMSILVELMENRQMAKHMKSEFFADPNKLEQLVKKLESPIVDVPAVYGDYQFGYVAAFRDVAKWIREACKDNNG